jgi:hypothetical protein
MSKNIDLKKNQFILYKIQSIKRNLEIKSKTLIGKNGYLFLQNDSAKELEVHRNNLDITNNIFLNNVLSIKNKYLLIVFPNKSLYNKEFLPDNYHLQYRPAFNKYANALDNHIIDGLSLFNSGDDIFYKTDTHMNIKGCLIIYNAFINKINTLFNLNIQNKLFILNKQLVESLTNLGLSIGDLTWKQNLGDQILNNIEDIYYSSNELKLIYPKKINNENKFKFLSSNNLDDETGKYFNTIIDLNIIYKHILYQKNEDINNKNKILIFYDSFLASTLDLYLHLFGEVYLSKSILNLELINIIKPDYIFEFRVERFLL